MASKIRVLSDHTINKIAAGEVIENPASVVKELVENSLDAGSTDICIEIQGGGRQMIRVSDNGCGMNSDDALLCLERHATSKLREVEEIHTLSTMGFRGEAIPSIASISKFNLLTCPAPENDFVPTPTGTMVIIDGGKIVSCQPAVRSQGTTIEVKSLFFNVPVRKKFLKSPTIDANEILKTVSLMALGYPSIKFQLISDGKNLLTAPPAKNASFAEQIQDRITRVLGDDFCRNMVFIEGQKVGIHLRGMIGEPGYTRHNRTGQYLFINKRGVVSPLVAYAVKEGFGTSLQPGRFPVFVLHLVLDGDLVDVNVHPQKREVRLRQEQLIKELIIKAVRSGISQGHSHDYAQVQVQGYAPFISDSTEPHYVRESIQAFAENYQFKNDVSQSLDEGVPETWTFRSKVEENAFSSAMSSKPYFSHFEVPFSTRAEEATSKMTLPELPAQSSRPYQPVQLSYNLTNSIPKDLSPKVMTTIPGYILLDGSLSHPFIECGCKRPEKKGLILIDQKNAHSRILFEKLSETRENSPLVQQTLLIPHTLELTTYESEALRCAIPSLNNMGIQIREFGTNTFTVDAIPQLFGNSNLDMLLGDIIHDLRSQQDNQFDNQVMQREQAKRIAQSATRAAISFQRRLSLFEAQSLIDQLVGCKQPYICPAGKPTLAQITFEELAKMFQK